MKLIPENNYGYPKNKLWYANEFSFSNPTSSTYYIDLFNGYSFFNFPTSSIGAAMISVSATPSVGTTPFFSVFNPSNNSLYVSNGSSNDVSVINCATNLVIATIPVGTLPQRLVLDTVDNVIYVVNQNSNDISAIDCATNLVIATITVGTLPAGISYNPTNNTIYVCNFNSNNVSVINCATNLVIATITVGTNPEYIVFNSVNNRMYLTNQTSNNISVVNCNSNIVISTIPIATFPNVVSNLEYNPLNNSIYVLVVNANSVVIIDCASNLVSDTISLTAINNVLIFYNASSNLLYVGGISNIYVINCGNNSLLTTITVGSIPFSIAYSSIDNFLYVSNFSSNNVSVIACAINQVTDTIAVGTNPAVAVLNTVNNNIYVTNSGSDTVSVLRNDKNFYVTGSTDYNQFVRELQNIPKRVRHIILTVESYSQMAVPFYILKRDANGHFCGVPKIPTEYLDTNDYQSFICELPFKPKELILNNQMIISQYAIAPNSTVKMVIYFDEIDMSDLLSEKLNVSNIIETKVEDLNSLTEKQLEDTAEFRPTLKPDWLKNFKNSKTISI